MAVLTPQQTLRSGTKVTFVNADPTDDSWENDGNQIVAIKNSGSGTITVTIPDQRGCDLEALHDFVMTVPNNGKVYYTPTFTPYYYNNVSGQTIIDCSAVTNVQLAVISVV